MNIRHLTALTGLLSLGGLCGANVRADAQTQAALRPPAVPLVTFNPYLSIWSEADRLTDDVTRHWTHRAQALDSLIRIDGKSYRLMGDEPKVVPALPQVSLRVLPTTSIYEFDNGHVHVTLTFLTAALPNDLNALARPLSYITWNVRSVDGGTHAVSVYDSVSSALAVNTPDQAVEWKREKMGGLTGLRAGTHSQSLLGSSGDDHQLDWGYAYLVAPTCADRLRDGQQPYPAGLLRTLRQAACRRYADAPPGERRQSDTGGHLRSRQGRRDRRFSPRYGRLR